MRPNVKPLTHWIIYRGYKVRFTDRGTAVVAGVLTAGDGTEVDFRYESANKVIFLPGERITINEHGWEVKKEIDA
jgi:hypothetical protein